MYIHIGFYKWKNAYLHMFYNTEPFRVGSGHEVIEYPVSILFVGTDPHIFTEFVKQKLIKEYHTKKKSGEYLYYFKGMNKLEMIETIERLKKYFSIDENKYNQLRDEFVLGAI